jgi:hypothetical protein
MLPTEWRQPATAPTSRIAKGGLHVISVSIPANPQHVGGYEPSIMPHNVTVSGNYACVADDTDGLQVIDVSNPSHPQRVGGYETGGNARHVAVSANYAWVADGSAGLQVIDVSNPSHPQRVGGYATGGYATGEAMSSNFVYVADRNAGVAVSGHFACVADWDRRLADPVTFGDSPFEIHDPDAASVRPRFYRLAMP